MSTAKERDLMAAALEAWSVWLDDDNDGHFERVVELIGSLATEMGLLEGQPNG